MTSLPAGTLYLVPTPLGNLGDITLRAIEVLKGADLVACEDTRRTLGLLNHLGISKKLWSYHAHSNAGKTRQLVEALQEGKVVAVVSDAGTPGLSDPGTELVQAALAENLPVISLPGACAAVTALVASGLPTDRFFFIGFLPRRPARARKMIAKALATESTLVIYESPYRVKATLALIRGLVAPATPVVIARELTKVYEEFIRGSVEDVLARLETKEIKGEAVILVQPVEAEEEKDDTHD